jgi:hypothetical protein
VLSLHSGFTTAQERAAPQEITLDALVYQLRWPDSFVPGNKSTAYLQLLNHFRPGVVDTIVGHLNDPQSSAWPSLYWMQPQFTCDTILFVVFIQARYSEAAERWETVVRVALSWVEQKVADPELLKKLMKIARDNMQMSDTGIPAPGSSDSSGLAAGKADPEIVMDEVGGGNIQNNVEDDDAAPTELM